MIRPPEVSDYAGMKAFNIYNSLLTKMKAYDLRIQMYKFVGIPTKLFKFPMGFVYFYHIGGKLIFLISDRKLEILLKDAYKNRKKVQMYIAVNENYFFLIDAKIL